MKQRGIGREGERGGLLDYAETKSVALSW